MGSALHGKWIEEPPIKPRIRNDRNNGRGRGIRTPDIQLPKLALYQTELYPGDRG